MAPKIAWVCSGLAVLLLLYNLRNAFKLSQAAMPARAAPRLVPTFRTSESIRAAQVDNARAPRHVFPVGGAPHFQPATPSVCAPRGQSRIAPVTQRPLNYVASRGCDPSSDSTALCDALSQAGIDPGSAVLLLVAAEGDEATLARFIQLACGVGVSGHLLVAALDAEAATAARALSPTPVVWDASAALEQGLPPPARKWALAGLLLSRGVSVLHVSLGVTLLGDPFLALFHDADIEAASDSSPGLVGWLGGGGGERGSMRVASDAVMGWSQMAESYQARPAHAGGSHAPVCFVPSLSQHWCARSKPSYPLAPLADPSPDPSLLVRRRHA
jgi:hypothetical protein